MIHISAPKMSGHERKYVLQALDREQLTGGDFVARCEASFAAMLDVQYALTCSSGTTALHLAMIAAGIGPGDEVIVPALTYIATANAVTYCGGTPVIADVDPATWTLDVRATARSITERTKAIIAVHLYGVPADMPGLRNLARAHGLLLVEDAAEAVGARSSYKQVGAWGDIAAFSFFGSKTLACGEGGMVVTNRADLAGIMRRARGQGVDGERRYWHTSLGYNYRMPELSAAVLLGQIECANEHLQRRRTLLDVYRAELNDGVIWQECVSRDDLHGAWLAALRVQDAVRLHRHLGDLGIETRPVFPPLHTQPIYWRDVTLPVAENVAASGICLPLHAGLWPESVRYICGEVRKCVSS